jgi:hypothetical protein
MQQTSSAIDAALIEARQMDRVRALRAERTLRRCGSEAADRPDIVVRGRAPHLVAAWRLLVTRFDRAPVHAAEC